MESDDSFDPDNSSDSDENYYNESELQRENLALKARVIELQKTVIELQKENDENKKTNQNLQYRVSSMEYTANIYTRMIRTLQTQVRLWRDLITAPNTATTAPEFVAPSGPRAVQDT